MTGMETAAMMPSIMSGSLMRAMPPCARMSAGTRSSAITATAPASSAILACSGVTTSMITPPLSCSAMPRFTRSVPVCAGTRACWGSFWATGAASQIGDADVPAYGGSAGAMAAAGRRPGEDGVQPVVDVEIAGQRTAGVQPQHAGEAPPAQGTGVPDGVVVEPPGQPHPHPHVVELGETDVVGHLAQQPAQGVLRGLPVIGGGGPGGRGPGRAPARR